MNSQHEYQCRSSVENRFSESREFTLLSILQSQRMVSNVNPLFDFRESILYIPKVTPVINAKVISGKHSHKQVMWQGIVR